MIGRAIRELEPTHALLGGPETNSTAAESGIVEAVAPLAGELAVEIDPLLGEDHPHVLAALEAAFERTRGGSSAVYQGSLADRDRLAVLSTLLSIDDWHRDASIRALVLASTGQPRLLYVPDHRSLGIDGAGAPAIETAARGALAGRRALLVSTATVAEWTEGDTAYALSPPWLRVGGGCLRLSRLAGIESDPRTRTIELRWSEPSYAGAVENSVIRPLVGAFSLIAPEKPVTIRLPDRRRYAAVEGTLREIRRAFQ